MWNKKPTDSWTKASKAAIPLDTNAHAFLVIKRFWKCSHMAGTCQSNSRTTFLEGWSTNRTWKCVSCTKLVGMLVKWPDIVHAFPVRSLWRAARCPELAQAFLVFRLILRSPSLTFKSIDKLSYQRTRWISFEATGQLETIKENRQSFKLQVKFEASICTYPLKGRVWKVVQKDANCNCHIYRQLPLGSPSWISMPHLRSYLLSLLIRKIQTFL
jgi:hypothetical protein